VRNARSEVVATRGRVVLAGLAVALLAACSAGTGAEETAASCDRGGCTDLPLGQIEEISGLDLPEDTEVVESSYDSFQDWRLGATLRLPEGAEDPVAGSAEPWDGTPDDDGVHRTVDTSTQDGHVVLVIEVFTT